jgi:aminopeptidase YwaD
LSTLNLREKAERHLKYLAEEIPSRRVGSDGNRLATDFFYKTIASFGLLTECPQFECMDWLQEGARLTVDGRSYHARVSPYSRGCSVTAPLETVSSVEELAAVGVSGKILLLCGGIAKEPLMPKNFRFYNPDEHRQIYALLESKNPLAIITATARNPEMAGAVYPFGVHHG